MLLDDPGDGPPPPLPPGRLRVCPACRADHAAHEELIDGLDGLDPITHRFVGPVPLGVPIEGWPSAVTVLALELWDRCAKLSYGEA